jgi:phospholipase/carboxylesterase
MTKIPAPPGISRRDFLKVGLIGSLAGPTLLSCSDSTTEPESNPRLTARPATPTVTPTTGLTELGLASPRDGLLYVPESYSPDVPAPLFVALHGAGGSADNWASYPERAEARGMVFLAPDSRGSTWDVVRGSFGPDVEFLDRALRHTFERCRIDPERIALGGFSDGASYALSLGVSNGDLFSHLVAYSPGFFRPADPIVGKPRVYVSHGRQDNVLPVAISRDAIVPTLRNADYDVTYQEFAGGHEVPAAISESALDWFLA